MQILRSQVNPIFQSTPSVWRETLSGFHSFQCFTISIHSLRMEGDNCSHRVTLQNVHFNPLPPYGGRPERRCLAMKRFKFQSTPSAWRETSRERGIEKSCKISIHSLRMEGDMATSYVPSGTSLFQSTPSAWRETEIVPTLRLSKYISIHSLRMEGDVSFLLRFQSMCISIHSLRMEGDYKIVLNGTYGISISIHSLRMEGDI